MLAPQLTETEKQTMMTEVFLGYNHNLELADGEFYDMENLSADEYPLLAPRRGRAGHSGEGCAVLGAEQYALHQRRFDGGVYAVCIHFGGGKAAHFHGRVSVHLPGWDLLQHREVLGQRVHGAGEHRQRGKHEH